MRKSLTRTPELYHYDAAGIRWPGPHAGLRGDCSGISGDLDECDLTAAERDAGVQIADLVIP